MPSPRTEPDRSHASRWARFDPRGPGAVLQRLNVRLVLALAIVALVGLIVSGIAITQILPGYFLEQTEQRMATAAAATGTSLRQEVDEAQTQGVNVLVSEVRDARVGPRTAAEAARLFNATVTVVNSSGFTVGGPTAPPDVDALEAQGLRRDSAVGRVRAVVDVRLPDRSLARYEVIMSDPYTSRQETLAQIQGALIGAGLLALLASLVTGMLAARSLTVPISRLRGVAGRVAQGQLDERADPSGVLEIDELGQQFNIMADRLAGTLRMLEADRDRLREFVADVSHELRTPIAALRLYTELQHEDEVDEATRREFLESSMAQISRLEWLSTNLLDLSRIDAGIFPLDIREGDIRDPVQAVVQAFSESAIQRGVALDSVVPAEPVEMRFDRERIVQLMTNLVGNALKFTPRGGSASVRLHADAESATITVRDTGPGIPADELPRIFERFYRGTNTGDARASGSGLGLAIVRSIVDMHEGEIDLASELGSGTEFTITLPRRLERRTDALEEKVNETSRATHPARNPGTVA
ncbi:MAG TPA: HAMP domain-containing sensor histidine kinase [Candidatus Limnocylindria bacterium]|nr:HAMP domain-containing sensor histidine kinase [Candidatus Limnocylindria bacterium]